MLISTLLLEDPVEARHGRLAGERIGCDPTKIACASFARKSDDSWDSPLATNRHGTCIDHGAARLA